MGQKVEKKRGGGWGGGGWDLRSPLCLLHRSHLTGFSAKDSSGRCCLGSFLEKRKSSFELVATAAIDNFYK